MSNAYTKFFLVLILSCMTLLSLVGIGFTLWTAWVVYQVGATKSCWVLCAIAAAFIVYQGYVIFKNKSEIINDLKDVWRGRGNRDA